MNPGRPRYEDRELAWVKVGDRVVDAKGSQWDVIAFEPEADGRVRLHLQREVFRGSIQVFTQVEGPADQTVRCRNRVGIER